jgi:hypothetical protein
LKVKYGNLEKEDIKRKDLEEFAYWQRIDENFKESKKEAETNFNMYSNMTEGFSNMADLVKDEFDVTDFDEKELAGFNSDKEKISAAIDMLKQMFGMIRLEGASINTIIAELEGAIEHFEVQAKYAYNVDFDPRSIVGDDPDDYKEKYYSRGAIAALPYPFELKERLERGKCLREAFTLQIGCLQFSLFRSFLIKKELGALFLLSEIVCVWGSLVLGKFVTSPVVCSS